MHFEILVEDKSGKILIDKLMEKIRKGQNAGITYRTIAYNGIGKFPENLDRDIDPTKRALLNKLPYLLRGYGKSLTDEMLLLIVIDCDKRNCIEFKKELINVYNTSCFIKPKTVFCLAIEELEAWLIGDRKALHKAYPNVRKHIFDSYVQDSQCDTWELLADAVYPQKAQGLKRKGYPEIGMIKCEWADKIAEFMDVEKNASSSFQYFIRKINEFAEPA